GALATGRTPATLRCRRRSATPCSRSSSRRTRGSCSSTTRSRSGPRSAAGRTRRTGSARSRRRPGATRRPGSSASSRCSRSSGSRWGRTRCGHAVRYRGGACRSWRGEGLMPRPPVPPILRRPLVGRQGPWRGDRGTTVPSSRDPTLAFRMRNVFPLTPEIGSGVVGRPGFRRAGAKTGPTVQWIGQFEKSGGTARWDISLWDDPSSIWVGPGTLTDKTIKIAGGEIYEYDWLTDSWVLQVSQAEIAAAGGALETAGRVWAVSFADVLVITDGVNKPITWDGTPGGGVAVLTNAPVMFGPPTVYYARLFAIKADDRSTIVWCEPGQPNVGWEAEGYNNSWTLRQTD